jgi:anti-sigma B factor antagonist
MDDTSGLDVRIERSERATVVRLRGDLDLATSGRLQRATTDDLLQGLVILDLAALSFCDSSGLRVLLALHRRVQGGGSGLRLAGPTAEVDRMLELSGTRDHFALYPDVAAALAG